MKVTHRSIQSITLLLQENSIPVIKLSDDRRNAIQIRMIHRPNAIVPDSVKYQGPITVLSFLSKLKYFENK